MKVELKIPVDLINDNEKVIKRNIITKHLIDLDDIKNPQEIFNSRGTIVKGKCKIYIKDIGSIVINHSYSSIKELINKEDKRIEIKGFKK